MEKAARVFEWIWRQWEAGTVTDLLPPEFRPRNRAEGYAAQAYFETRSAFPRAGWKIAATSDAGQRHIGVDGPLVGRLLKENIRENGAAVDLTTNRMRVAEPEFAFRFAESLSPRSSPYALAEVLQKVGALHLAVEIPDSRFLDFAHVGEASLIADNACARELVISPAVTADWRAADLSSHAVQAHVAGRYAREGFGANVLGDPRVALAWSVNEITGMGISIEAGELITTGTCTTPLEIEPGDKVTVDFGLFGGIEVRISH